MSESKAAVPKFASFRPKQSQQRAEPVETSRSDRGEQDRKDKHPSQRRDHSRERDRGRDRDRRRPPDDERRRHRKDSRRERHTKERNHKEALVVTDARTLSKELSENASDYYRIDTKGDPDNLRYRTLHKWTIPEYRRVGRGAVLGAPSHLRIDRSIPGDKGIMLSVVERAHKSTSSLLAKPRTAEQRRLRLVRPEQEESTKTRDRDLDFIELPRVNKRKRRSESPDHEYGEVEYRSIEGKAKPSNQPADSDLEYASSSDEGTDDGGRATRLHNAALSKQTKEKPQDLDAWTELIEHQREVLGFGIGDLPLAQRRTLADIRISIYEQALAVMKSSAAKAKLTLGMLDEGAKFWELKTLANKWDEALRGFSNDVSIWTAYLNFIQSSHSEFRYERCKEEYLKCINILGQTLQQTYETRLTADTSRILVYVYLRLTSLMRDAGYHEFSTALWQAVFELHFFRPPALRDEQQAADSFEAFWESEVPRIGEEGARGWLNYSTDTQDAPDAAIIDVGTIEGPRHLFNRFAKAEREAASKLAMPGRSADDAGEDDPYHVVLFNDLSYVLFPFLWRLENTRDLIMAFLRSANLPPLPYGSHSHFESWWLDPMLPWSAASIFLVPHYQTTTETLFTDIFAYVTEEDMKWCTTVLTSLVDACPRDEILAEYVVALEFYLRPANASKLARRLLKARSSSMRLYNCYAILETRNKGLEAGTRIFATAISMSASLDQEQQRLKVLLYRTWVWEALRVNDAKAAMRILLTLGGDANETAIESFSPALELRTRQWLQDGREAMLSIDEPQLAVHYAELMALLAYFRDTSSIEAALTVYDSCEELFASRKMRGSPADESLHQAKAHIVTYHIENTHLYRPSLLRSAIGKSIVVYPNNTILLVAYTKVGPQLNILAPHSLMDDTVLSPPNATVIGYTFALDIALQRGLTLGGTPHAIRALFDRALAPMSPNEHSTHLWTAYLRFEIETQRDYTRAREIFMRGLMELPWVKWWIVRGLETLGEVLGWEDGWRVWRVLGEREMRVILDVESIVEDEWQLRRGEDT